MPQLDPLSDQQWAFVSNLRQACQQAEDALKQGLDKLQLNLAEAVASGHLGEGNYIPQVATALEKLEALVSFVNQVLKHMTMVNMYFNFFLLIWTRKHMKLNELSLLN